MTTKIMPPWCDLERIDAERVRCTRPECPNHAKPFRCTADRGSLAVPCSNIPLDEFRRALVNWRPVALEKPAEDPAPIDGPGAELKALLEQLGATVARTCPCNSRIDRMNRWGASGCRESRETILEWLTEAKNEFGVAKLLAAGVKALWSGLPLTIGGLVDEAIRRAAVKESLRLPVVAAAEPAPAGPLRVGVVTPILITGGVERWLIGLAKHLPADVTIGGVSILDGGASDEPTARELARYTKIRGSRILDRDGGRNSPKWIERLPVGQAAVDQLAAESDVLLCWGIRDQLPVPKSFAGPIVLVSHGSCSWTRQWLAKSVPGASHFTAVSEFAAEPYPDAIRPLVKVLHNGAELDRVTPARPRDAVRRELQLPAGAKAVGFLGRFSEEKDPLAAAVAVGALGEPYYAVYVGRAWNAQAEADFRRKALEAAGGRCRFVAPPDHVGDYLGAFDCLLMASPSEGFCLAIIEAWLAGVPVVATPVGAIPEAEAVHGRLSWSVLPGEPATHRAGIREACEGGRNEQRVLRARAVAWEHYSAAAMAHRWADYLRAVVQTNHARDNGDAGRRDRFEAAGV